jgi:Sec-independent protein translocase protein TatA
MELLGVGPMELFFIVILALIILGPRDMQKAGKTMGKWMNNLVKSDTWKLVRQASNKIKYLPNELMREAGLDEIKKAGTSIEKEIGKELTRDIEDPFKAWREKNPSTKAPGLEVENKEKIIEPPQPAGDGGKENA